MTGLDLNPLPGNTPIDPDELAELIPTISDQQELNELESKNITEAHEWAFSSRRFKVRDPLTEPYVRELHKRMFDQVWKWAGEYRKKEKRPGILVHQIREELPKLLADARFWIDRSTYDNDETAIRLHHSLVWIHPFPNGNGRHARLLADIVVVKLGRTEFSWGSRKLVESGAARNEYIRCLRLADANHDDIQPLLKFARS
jgi:Fic-DOC domain mobile mystery protein B